jgi:predicted esterase
VESFFNGFPQLMKASVSLFGIFALAVISLFLVVLWLFYRAKPKRETSILLYIILFCLALALPALAAGSFLDFRMGSEVVAQTINDTTINNPTVDNVIKANSINGLLNLEQDIPVPISDIKATANALWDKYKSEVCNQQERQQENTDIQYTFATDDGNVTAVVRMIILNGNTMRFTVDKKGIKPTAGYPVFIALHGGGSSSDALDNDDDWYNVQGLWGRDVDPGIYIAVRGISNTWDLHFRPDSYPMYDRLIENMIACEDADPNAIYLMGFSAGGDGVYQITPRMGDRFGATNMMAGHPNGVNVDNYRNVPFLVQVGEEDREYNRNLEAARYNELLNSKASSRGGYAHDTFIHAGGDHNNWIPETYVSPQPNTIIDNIAEWLQGNGSGGGTIEQNTASVTWMKQHRRNPLPSRVIWDTSTRADKRLTKGFYWLDAGSNPDGSLIDIEYSRDSNTINVSQLGSYVEIQFSPQMVDFSQPVTINKGQDRFAVQLKASLKKMVETLVDRGDPNYIFSDDVVLENAGGTLKVSGQPSSAVDNTVIGLD